MKKDPMKVKGELVDIAMIEGTIGLVIALPDTELIDLAESGGQIEIMTEFEITKVEYKKPIQ